MKKIILHFFLLCLFSIVNAQSGHSGKNLECTVCHACEKPTRTNPCLVICPRENVITIKDLPEDAPKNILINKIKNNENIYEPVIFSHLAHAEMSAMSGGCEICHHYNSTTGVMGCDDCHEPTRNRIDVKKPDLKGAYHRQCISCHNQWGGSDDCESCHVETGKTSHPITLDDKIDRIHPQIKEPTEVVYETTSNVGNLVTFYHDEHNELFGLQCDDCHSDESCIRCHHKTATKFIEERKSSNIHYQCSDCHDTENKIDCGLCHMGSKKSRFDHTARTGFDLTRFHSKLKCETCHQVKNDFKRVNKECLECHQWSPEKFKHQITGLRLDETHEEFDCEDCHVKKNFKQPECGNCHDDFTYPEKIPGVKVKK